MENYNNNNNDNDNYDNNIRYYNNNISIEELIVNGTLELIITKMNQMFLEDNNNEGYNLVLLMAIIDKRFHFDETIAEYNYRIRQSIANNFNKFGVSDNKLEYFRIWQRNVELLPENASRVELFNVAPIAALHIVGL